MRPGCRPVLSQNPRQFVFGLLLTGKPLSLWTLYGVVALTGIASLLTLFMIPTLFRMFQRVGVNP
jgi:Cu/Ag efflux pump CusA